MIEITSNAGEVFMKHISRLTMLTAQNMVLREVAVSMLPVVRDRIHVRGEDASGAKIGTYSDEYMKVRNGQFKNDGFGKFGSDDSYTVVAKKAKTTKGRLKSAGTFTKGQNAGTPRPIFNRGSDKTVIISLTGLMERDFSVQEIGERLGLGYNNPTNSEKVEYVEHTFNKKIFGLTPAERDMAIDIANTAVNKIMQGDAA